MSLGCEIQREYFGYLISGVEGLEAAIKADSSISSDLKDLFPHYLNVCPSQTSRTIRTEEAVLISLSVLCPKFKEVGLKKS